MWEVCGKWDIKSAYSSRRLYFLFDALLSSDEGSPCYPAHRQGRYIKNKYIKCVCIIVLLMS